MNSGELYESGRLHDAVRAAAEEVKARPADTRARSRFCELLCAAGDLERADKQLDVVARQNPKAAVGVSLFRQLIRAENARRQFYESGRVPEVLDKPSYVIERHLEASIYLRSGERGRAAELLTDAAEKYLAPAGECDGEAFTEFRDLDDLCAPVLEVLTCNGTYYWIALDQIESIEFRPPECIRDLLWLPARALFRVGPEEAEIYVPALYYGSHLENDQAVQLGRATRWLDEEGGPVLGRGLRMFLVGDNDQSILKIRRLSFQPSL